MCNYYRSLDTVFSSPPLSPQSVKPRRTFCEYNSPSTVPCTHRKTPSTPDSDGNSSGRLVNTSSRTRAAAVSAAPAAAPAAPAAAPAAPAAPVHRDRCHYHTRRRRYDFSNHFLLRTFAPDNPEIANFEAENSLGNSSSFPTSSASSPCSGSHKSSSPSGSTPNDTNVSSRTPAISAEDDNDSESDSDCGTSTSGDAITAFVKRRSAKQMTEFDHSRSTSALNAPSAQSIPPPPVPELVFSPLLNTSLSRSPKPTSVSSLSPSPYASRYTTPQPQPPPSPAARGPIFGPGLRHILHGSEGPDGAVVQSPPQRSVKSSPLAVEQSLQRARSVEDTRLPGMLQIQLPLPPVPPLRQSSYSPDHRGKSGVILPPFSTFEKAAEANPRSKASTSDLRATTHSLDNTMPPRSSTFPYALNLSRPSTPGSRLQDDKQTPSVGHIARSRDYHDSFPKLITQPSPLQTIGKRKRSSTAEPHLRIPPAFKPTAPGPLEPSQSSIKEVFSPHQMPTPADSTVGGPSFTGEPYSATTQQPTSPAAPLSANFYKCDFPGCKSAPFHTQYLLNSHANVHSNDRPYYCEEPDCKHSKGGIGFKRKNEMKRHGLVHKSPDYVCPYCPDLKHKYPRPDNLIRHVRACHPGMSIEDDRLRLVLSKKPDGGGKRRRRVNSH